MVEVCSLIRLLYSTTARSRVNPVNGLAASAFLLSYMMSWLAAPAFTGEA